MHSFSGKGIIMNTINYFSNCSILNKMNLPTNHRDLHHLLLLSQINALTNEYLINKEGSETPGVPKSLPKPEININVYKFPKNLNTSFTRERRNRQRVTDNNRDITPFKIYYQN